MTLPTSTIVLKQETVLGFLFVTDIIIIIIIIIITVVLCSAPSR